MSLLIILLPNGALPMSQGAALLHLPQFYTVFLLGFMLALAVGIGWMTVMLWEEKRHYCLLLGVIILAMVSGTLPFLNASNDPHLWEIFHQVQAAIAAAMMICGILFLRVLLNTRFIAKHFDLLLLSLTPLLFLNVVIAFTSFSSFWQQYAVPMTNVLVFVLLLVVWMYALRENATVLRLNKLKFVAALGFIILSPGEFLLQSLLRAVIPVEQRVLTMQTALTLDFVLFFLGLLSHLHVQHKRLRTAALERSNVEQEAVTEYRKNDALRRANAEILTQQELLQKQSAQIEHMNIALQENNRQLGEQNIQLKELHKEKDEFLGIVAHDLKNPLAGIASFANIIKYDDGSLTSEQRKEFVGHIIESSERMFEIIRNLLEINTLERGGMRVLLQPIELSSMLDYAVGSYTERAAQKRILLEKDFTEPAIALADEHLIMQVVDNLISNAVKYSPHESTVTIRVQCRSSKIRLEIQDQGPGLTEEDKAKLFGKFARLSAQPTGGEHSTGLGLSIVKKMVEVMQGAVWCESTAGEGATFVVELPEASAEAGL